MLGRCGTRQWVGSGISSRWSNTPLGRGYGPWDHISVTKVLGELGWRKLADQRRDNRLTLLYKVLKQDIDGHISINRSDLDLLIHRPNTYKKHRYNLSRITGKDTHSPLWQGSVCRTVTEWNGLNDSTFELCESTAAPFTTFKAQLAGCP